MSFTASVFLHMGLFRNCRCIICYTNPPILPDAALLASKLHKTKLIFVIYDVYPEVAYASGSIQKGSLIDRNMQRINHAAYKRADQVIVLSDEMRQFILHNRPETDEQRVKVIHNWAHEENEQEMADIAEGITDGAPGINNISYFGNMGICQDVETMLHAAKEMNSDNRIHFELTGHGNKKDSIERYIRKADLRNISVHGYLTGKSLYKELRKSTCCVVSLTNGLKGLCAPSKYYTYLYMGKPVISVMEKDSYISREVEDEKIGFAVAVGDSAGFQSAVRFLQENPELTSEMGKKARALYLRKYRYDIAMSEYRSVAEAVLNRGVHGRNERKRDNSNHSDKE